MKMPWTTSSIEEERRRFVELARRRDSNISDLARSFGVSRKTAYKWLERFATEGLRWSTDRSRRPNSSPQAMAKEVAESLLALRKRHPLWGPKKLLHLLKGKPAFRKLPAPSSVSLLFKRHGLVRPRRRRGSIVVPPIRRPRIEAASPNALWCVDFKGEFRLGNGEYCWPLTVTDAATRYLIACIAMPKPLSVLTVTAFEEVFSEYGLPEAILSDNGTPFASDGLWGLTLVSGRWLRYGIAIQRTRPGRPQDNGRHERFHRTLKEATALPPCHTLLGQQRRFDHFRLEYNELRPHEALGMKTPADLYTPSPRKKPHPLPAFRYPGHFYCLWASEGGSVTIKGTVFHIGRWAAHERIALEELRGQRFRVHFGKYRLGELDLSTGRIISYGPKGSGKHLRMPSIETAMRKVA